MRVDHFVVKPPKKNTYPTIKGINMSNNALTTPSITKSMGFAPSESVWIEMKKKNASDLVWGRIQSTGLNYIVEGYREYGDIEWVRIPCRRLQDAQLLLGTVMPKKDFALHRELKDINNKH
jgi:reverse gyrase